VLARRKPEIAYLHFKVRTQHHISPLLIFPHKSLLSTLKLKSPDEINTLHPFMQLSFAHELVTIMTFIFSLTGCSFDVFIVKYLV